MNKQEFKRKVGMGFFSCEWVNNAGTISKVKRGILGGYAWRHTNNPIPTNVPTNHLVGFPSLQDHQTLAY